MGGLAVALLGRAQGKPGHVQTGLAWFIRATLAQAVFGTWFLVSLPQAAMLRFLGGDPVSSLFLAAGLALTVAALYAAWRGNVPGALLWTVLTVAAMVLVRDRLRTLLLSPYHDIRSMASFGEYSPMALFLAVFILAIPLLGWLIRQYLRAKEA